MLVPPSGEGGQDTGCLLVESGGEALAQLVVGIRQDFHGQLQRVVFLQPDQTVPF